MAKCGIFTDLPVYVSPTTVEVWTYCNGAERDLTLSYEVIAGDGVRTGSISIKGKVYPESPVALLSVTSSGRMRLYLVSNGVGIDSLDVYVLPSNLDVYPIYLTMVFHQHQAPMYLPGYVYRHTWHIKHTAGDYLDIALSGGAYRYHALIHNKYPMIKATHNLSPSLLKQWQDFIDFGYLVTEDGNLVSDPSVIEIIKNTIKLFRSLASEGRIEVLTSVYAHTILGYLIDRFGLRDLVTDELSYGIKVTKSVMGVHPEGVWTPEMAFTMDLIALYSDLGIKYTVLDDKYHLPDPAINPYSTYHVKHKGKCLGIVFRNNELSNKWSFTNNFDSIWDVKRTANRLVADIIMKGVREGNGSLICLALDGENWIVFSKTPKYAALFLDQIYTYLDKLQNKQLLKTVTLKEAFKSQKIRHLKLDKELPTNSWLGSFKKWDGEVKQHSTYWSKISNLIKDIEKSKNKLNPRVYKAVKWSLYHALDSDYWWAEFWDPSYIDAWLSHAKKLLDEGKKLT